MARITKAAYAEKRENILRRGIDLFLQKGFNGVGVQEIAQAADIPKGSFFNYFNSKTDFARATIDYTMDIYIPYYQEMLQNSKQSPLERLQAFYDANIHGVQVVMAFSKGCILNQLTQELANNDQKIADLLKNSLTTLQSELKKVLKEAQVKGEISVNHNIEELAVFIDNSWRGTMVMSRSLQDVKAMKAFKNYLFNYILV